MSVDDAGGSLGLGISSIRPFVMTSAFENDRSAILVEWVQQCAMSPPMICVAVRKGRPIEPLIRDSRAFALCEIADSDRTLERLIRKSCEHEDDILERVPYESVQTGSPCIVRSARALDCEVIRHVDFEADYELYIAQVLQVKVYSQDAVQRRTTETAPEPVSAEAVSIA